MGGAILLIGANGQLGDALQRTLPQLGSVAAYDVPAIDLSQPETVRALVRTLSPAIIVNAAAYTAVDKAEQEPALAEAINAVAPGVLAEEAEAIGAVFVHYSTDYVFDGTKATPYLEADRPNPLSVYGSSKRVGEVGAARCRTSLILRTSWVFSHHGQNFIKTVLRLAKDRDALRIVADQIGAPTSARWLAEASTALLAQMMGAAPSDARWGLYHAVCEGETSWHGLACHVLARAHAAGLALRASPETTAPIATADYPTLARRPANSRLDTAKLRRHFAMSPPAWQDEVDAALERIFAQEAS